MDFLSLSQPETSENIQIRATTAFSQSKKRVRHSPARGRKFCCLMNSNTLSCAKMFTFSWVFHLFIHTRGEIQHVQDISCVESQLSSWAVGALAPHASLTFKTMHSWVFVLLNACPRPLVSAIETRRIYLYLHLTQQVHVHTKKSLCQTHTPHKCFICLGGGFWGGGHSGHGFLWTASRVGFGNREIWENNTLLRNYITGPLTNLERRQRQLWGKAARRSFSSLFNVLWIHSHEPSHASC